MKVLRLPWEEWGETDLMLLQAADLHDRLVCSCGCGQWEADAHDPLKKHLWQIEYDLCFVRRAINTFVEQHDLPDEAVLSIRLTSGDAEASKSDYEQLLERFPHLAARQAEARARAQSASAHGPDDEADDGRREQQHDDQERQ